jgi:hypothetical protein
MFFDSVEFKKKNYLHLGLGDNIGKKTSNTLIIWKFICTMVSYRHVPHPNVFEFYQEQ